MKNNRFAIAGIFLLFLAVLACYIGSAASRFQYDDIRLVVLNTGIRGLNDLGDVFAAGRPVRTLSFIFDYAVWGLNPRGFHLTNIILHFAASSLLFIFLLRVTGSRDKALAAAILFAVHPAGTEAVVNVSHRKEMLALLFMLGSLIFYDLYRKVETGRPKKITFAIGGFFCFLLALGSKQVAIVAPLLMLYLDYLDRGTDSLRKLAGKWPYLAPLALLPVVFVVAGVGDWNVFGFFPFKDIFSAHYFGIVAVSGWAILRYFMLMFLPIHLQVDYPIPAVGALTALCGFGLLGAVLYSSFRSRNNKSLSLALFWIAANLLPVLNLIPANEPFAERYLYIPLAGGCLLIANALDFAKGRAVGTIFKTMFYASISTVSCLWWAVRYWKGSENWAILAGAALSGPIFFFAIDAAIRKLNFKVPWKTFAARFAMSAIAISIFIIATPPAIKAIGGDRAGLWTHDDYMQMLEQFKQMRPKEAADFDRVRVRKAHRINKGFLISIAALSVVVAFIGGAGREGRGRENFVGVSFVVMLFAALTLNRVQQWRTDARLWGANIKTNPGSITAAVNYGVTARKFNDFRGAIWAYSRANRLDPNNPAGHLNLALSYLAMNKFTEAEKEFAETVRIDPLNIDARLNLANIYQLRGNLLPAVNEYRQIIQMDPKNAKAYYNMSIALAGLGRIEEAKAACLQAIEIAPDFTQAIETCGAK